MLRAICSFLLLLMILITAHGQSVLHISSGTYVISKGKPSVVLQGTSWVNDGIFTADTSRVIFTGDQANTISGNSETFFYQVELDKSSQNLLLAQAVQVADSLFFISGTLALGGNDLTLGTTGGVLIGESETSRVTGIGGGEIVKVVDLNAPSGENPGNMGIEITSSSTLGTTIIRRGQLPQALAGGTSINRYFEIIPSNNSGLDATLRFRYFDAELNGIVETELEFVESGNNGGSWSPSGFAMRDAAVNYIEQSGFDQLGRFTVTALSGTSFPVEWLGFDAWPVGEDVQCQWLTASEINSDYFEVERSVDGSSFMGIGRLAAAGNSQEILTYDLMDDDPMIGTSYYRVRQVDFDGSVQYSPMVAVTFAPTANLRLFPNPAEDHAWLDLQLHTDTALGLTLIDMQGKICYQQQQSLHAGPHRFGLDVSKLPEGVYTLIVRTGRDQSSLRLIVK